MDNVKYREFVSLLDGEEYKKGNLVVRDKRFCDENVSSLRDVDFRNVTLENIEFINCKFPNLGFAFSTFKNCLFKNSYFDGFGTCKFEDCIFDGFAISHNSAFNRCEYHNLITTKQQNMSPCNVNATYYDTDLSDQENILMTNNGCVIVEHYHFINSKIDLNTIKRMAEKCEYLWFRAYTPENLCKSKVGEDMYAEPETYFYAHNASKEVKMNFIMAMFAHDLTFEIDNTDTSLDYLPIHVTSKLKDETLFIVDEEGREVDLTKIVPFDFDLRWNDNMVCEYDLSICNDKIKVVPTKE